MLAIGVPVRVGRPGEGLSGAIPEGNSNGLSKDVSEMGIVFSGRLRLRLGN